VGARWSAPGGWVIQTADDGHGRPLYRVTRWGGWFIGYPADLAALEAMLARSGVRPDQLAEED
jgi:hypothetical protein